MSEMDRNTVHGVTTFLSFSTSYSQEIIEKQHSISLGNLVSNFVNKPGCPAVL